MSNKRNVYMFIFYFYVYLMLIPKISALNQNIDIQIYIEILLSTVFTIIYCYLNKEAFKNFISKLLEVCDHSIYIGIISIVLLAISIICNIAKLNLSVSSNAGYSSLIEEYKNNMFLYGIYIVFLTPLVEEITYKYILFHQTKFLEKRYVLKAVIISFIFSSLHILNEIIQLNPYAILDFMNYFTFGLITTLIYKKRDNILYPLAIHMLCNGVALYFV